MAWRLIFAVGLFIGALHSQVIVPQSPCPQYFQYYYEGGTTKGHLRIPPPQDYAEITIQLHMLVNTHLTTNYYGDMELLEDKDAAVWRLQRGDFSLLPLRVNFPVRNPLPVLISLIINGRDVCYQNPGTVIGPYTMLNLKYTLKMSVTIFPNLIVPETSRLPTFHNSQPISPGPAALVVQSYYNSRPATSAPIQWTTRQTTTPTPQTTQQTTTTQLPQTTEKDTELKPPFVGCGIQHKKDTELHGFNAFVLDSVIQRSEWPWLVSIFRAPPTFKFACAGTLVSSKHVVTAESCLTESFFSPRKLLVYLGKFDLYRLDEHYSYAQEVGDVSLYGGTTSSDAILMDLAIITFKNPVHFDEYIRPICLHRDHATLLDSVIVGWGATDFDVAKDDERIIPKKVKMILRRDKRTCQNYSPKMIGENALCADQKSRTNGVCKEDRGGGLYGKDSEGRWFLQGVVSSSDWESSSCINPSASVLLTSAMTTTAKFWITDMMSK